MAPQKQLVGKVRGFTSLAEHDAAAAVEGQVTAHVFDEKYRIRRIIYKGEAYYSVVDVIAALTDSSNPRNYWYRLKDRLDEVESAQLSTLCRQLKLPSADGKHYSTECANIKTMLRIVQSVPSPNAEPIKEWLAQVGFERIQETAEPDRAAQRMVQAYRDQGYSDDWIERRIKQAMLDSGWSEEVVSRDISYQGETAIRNKVHEAAMGITQKQHRALKGVTVNAELPDEMNKMELLIDSLAKAAGSEIIKARDAYGQDEVREAAVSGAQIAGNARAQIEQETGHAIITRDHTMNKPVNRKRLR